MLYLFNSKLVHFPDFDGGTDVLIITCEPAPKSKWVIAWLSVDLLVWYSTRLFLF